MAFVVDASVAASWAFPDEGHPVASEALNRVRTEPAQVPSLWWFEVRNTLIVNERRGRITEANTATFLLDIGRLPIVIDRTPDGSTTLMLARQHRLSVYDASYLELALRLGLPLATLDKDLRQAAVVSGSALLGEAARA